MLQINKTLEYDITVLLPYQRKIMLYKYILFMSVKVEIYPQGERLFHFEQLVFHRVDIF